jgi:ABC-type glycerol-3-phosphate transport system substrate-binding protein
MLKTLATASLMGAGGLELLAACNTGSPSAAVTPGGPTTLTMSHWVGWMADFIPMIKAKTGIDIQADQTPYPQYFQKLLAQLVSGTAPDMFLSDAGQNGSIWPSNQLAPFDDYLKTANIDTSKWNIDPLVENGYRGKTMGLSVFTMEDLMVNVNIELAQKDGLLAGLPLYGTPTYDTWKWDQFVQWLQAGTKILNNGRVVQYGFGASLSQDYIARTLIADLGGHIFDDDIGYNETKCLVDQPPVVEAIQMTADLVTKYKVMPTDSADFAVTGGTFAAKQALSAVSFTTPTGYPEASTFPQVYFAFPYVQRKVHMFGANMLCVNKNSPKKDAAFKWALTFCTDPDVRTKFVNVSLPAYDPLPIVNAMPAGSAKTIALINLSRIQSISADPADAVGVYDYPRWYGRKASAFTQQTLHDGLVSVILGKATAQQAMTTAKQAIDAELALVR